MIHHCPPSAAGPEPPEGAGHERSFEATCAPIGALLLGYMNTVTRLVTYADVSHRQAHPGQVSITARHELELADGRRVMLLNDRGWGSSGTWAELSLKEVQENARTVVGPDEPPKGRSREEEADLHWSYLERIAQKQGVAVDADELRQLPHDVVLSRQLLATIGAGDRTE
jgi:hypothetical protein